MATGVSVGVPAVGVDFAGDVAVTDGVALGRAGFTVGVAEPTLVVGVDEGDLVGSDVGVSIRAVAVAEAGMTVDVGLLVAVRVTVAVKGGGLGVGVCVAGGVEVPNSPTNSLLLATATNPVIPKQ